ncbi:pilus assembly PilX N-terminal domain-containing protein [Tissierella sp. MB52-C2]|uniref:pilus assembly PilX N-terminal domain-containing protein n=1 Tax=Tissierella sp. MB52-C2 TaxID=3070999 RepID=UPI00280BA334|nr:pilus assembly PilX N-terminal domain-containing protein [Tissierella sp. MB52-C2]WMM26942.1 pilus assembly PilX N-terminal domain-containing protein [Tissierella sp. MB52-C2]
MKFKNRRGLALVNTLIIFAVLMIFGTVALGLMSNENKVSLHHQYKTSAYYIARSGVEAVEAAILTMDEEEAKKLNEKLENNNRVDVEEIVIGEGKAKVILFQDNGNMIIESVGEINKVTEKISKEMYIEKHEENKTVDIDMAIFADVYMKFENNTQNNVIGDIGTNSSSENAIEFTSGFNDQLIINIPIGSDSTEVINKPDWDKKEPKVEYIEKRIYSLPSFFEYPANLPHKGVILTNSINTNPIIDTSAYYDSLIIESNRSATIDTTKGDIVLRIKDFDVQQGHIKVLGTGKIKLFIENYKSLKGGFNLGGNPNKVEIYYNGKENLNITDETKIFGSLYVKQADINIRGRGAVNGNLISGGNNITISGGSYVHNGVIYAPEADIKFLGSGNVKGGVVGKNVTLSGGASVEYDPAYVNNIQIGGETSNSSSIVFKPSHYK